MEESADRAPQASPSPPPAAEPEEQRKSFRDRAEYLVFRVGLAGSVLWLVGVALLQIFAPKTGAPLAALTALTAISRALAISTAFEAKLAWPAIAAGTITVETLIMLILYPLVVFSCEQLARARFFGGVLDAAIRAAHRHRPRVARYGVPGLLLFVWFPFWSTGPLVGAVIGYFLGMRVWLILSAVTAGTVLAVLSWVLLFGQLHALAAGFSHMLPLVILVILVGLAVAVNIRTRLKRRRARREDQSPPAPPEEPPPQNDEKPGAPPDA